MKLSVCVLCVWECVRACVRVCVRACACAGECVLGGYCLLWRLWKETMQLRSAHWSKTGLGKRWVCLFHSPSLHNLTHMGARTHTYCMYTQMHIHTLAHMLARTSARPHTYVHTYGGSLLIFRTLLYKLVIKNMAGLHYITLYVI